MRAYVKSYMKQTNYDGEILSEFFYPKKPARTYTWWDVRLGQPKFLKRIIY